MKKVEAIIQEHKLEDITNRLRMIGVQGMTVSHAKGLRAAGSAGPSADYRGSHSALEFVPRLRLEIVTDDNFAQAVVNAILLTARTDGPGSGKIFVSPVEEAIRIRTGEMGPDAL